MRFWETVAMVVAWIALGVSALAVLVSLYAVVRDRPRLGVMTRNDVNVRIGEEAEYTWHVTVINYGRQAQAVSDVGLVGKDAGFAAAVSVLRGGGVQVVGPELPAMVPPYGFLNWTVPDEAMRQRFPKSGQEFRAFVARYRPVFSNVRLSRIDEAFRSRGRRVMGTVREYQHGYGRMPER